MSKSPRKLSQTLTEEQFAKLNRYIHRGDRRRIFSVIIDGLIEILESPEGPKVMGRILTKDLSTKDLIERGLRDG